VGVFLPIDLTSKSPEEGLFQSAAAIGELQRVEHQLGRLAQLKTGLDGLKQRFGAAK
jgi:hypothetical protein